MKEELSEEDHRIDYLVENWYMKPSEARQWVSEHSPTIGEAYYLLGRRAKEFTDAVKEAFGISTDD